jgi:ribose-phosphate pyrophosphokinase
VRQEKDHGITGLFLSSQRWENTEENMRKTGNRREQLLWPPLPLRNSFTYMRYGTEDAFRIYKYGDANIQKNSKSEHVMSLTIFSGTANCPLAEAVAHKLGLSLGRVVLQRFPDGEFHVEIHESVRGHDVYLIQPTGPPVDTHLLALLLLADACRRAGAAQLTAVMPYFGYARQDRRASGREPVAARLIADLLQTSGLGRVVAVDLHTPALEGFFPIPLEHVSAVSLLAEAVRPWVPPNAVIVAPDLGAVKLAERYASLLHLPIAIVQKMRLSGEEVQVQRVMGDVRGCVPIVVDDMIGTGGTIEAAIKAVLVAGCSQDDIAVVASHGLFVGPAGERLHTVPIRRFLVTDSVTRPAGLPFCLHVTSLGPLLAEAITRLHTNQSLNDLIVHG